MVVGEIPEGLDLLVVGGGPGGYVAALRAAQLGRQVTLIDADGEAGLGGVCVGVGCIPSKALIEAAHTVHAARDGAAQGIDATVAFDMGRWQDAKKSIIEGLAGGVRGLMRAAGVDVRSGRFRFTRPDQGVWQTPDGQAAFCEFTHAIVATGSRPVDLPHLPRDGVRILDSTDALALTRLPAAVAVVGGGYIGVELATALAKLGSRVTVVEALDRLLPAMDPAVAGPVAARLRRLGVEVLLGAQATGDDGAALTVTSETGEQVLPVDAVIVAVGRRPNTDDVGLERLGVASEPDGRLGVGPDRRLTPQVAAIGDVTPGPALAHKASAEGIVAAEALSGHRVAFAPAAIPAVVFSDPEVAVAGASSGEPGTRTSRFPVSASGRAATVGARDGFAQVVSDAASGVVVGAQVVAPHAAELIGELVVAIEMGATLRDLALSIHPHPTMSEVWMEAAHVGLGEPVHVPGAKR